MTSDNAQSPTEYSRAIGMPVLGRCAAGGVLMGLANLVPGISGGTMLLAAGIYRRFIDAVAEISTFRFRRDSILVVAAVVVSAGVAIALLAGPVKSAVVDHRWIMYALFIGLTLGGVPTLWRLVRPATTATWFGAAAGFVVMAMIALLQHQHLGAGAGSGGSSPFLLVLAGVAGASAMILPGVSGAYLLLVLGQYVPILQSISRVTDALKAGDVAAALHEWPVIVPVGVGVLLGVVVVSNVLRFVLHRYEKATLGVLLGLLVGAVVGLWPFQRGVPPVPGTVVKGQVLTLEAAAMVDPSDWPIEIFTPSPGQIAGAIGMVVVGVAITMLIARIGNGRQASGDASGDPAA